MLFILLEIRSHHNCVDVQKVRYQKETRVICYQLFSCVSMQTLTVNTLKSCVVNLIVFVAGTCLDIVLVV